MDLLHLAARCEADEVDGGEARATGDRLAG
jgi:hypothetical protein